MKLLYLNHNVIGRGTYQRAFGFGREMARRGHEVTLVTISPDLRMKSRESSARGVRLVQSPDLFGGSARSGWDPWNAAWRTWRLRGERFDLIHAFDSRPAVIVPALSSRRRSGATFVMDWCDWWGRGGAITERSGWLARKGFAPVETFFEETFRRRPDGTTVISRALFDRAVGLGVPPETILRVVNGADVDEIDPIPVEEARRRLSLPVPPGAPVVGYLGRLSGPDADLLFSAFRRISSSLPEARLLLIGDPTTLPPSDQELARRLLRPGYVTDRELPLYLASCTAFLLPLADTLANRARWPGKVGDYLAAARPVVTTAVGEAAETLTGEGVVVVDADAVAIADAAIEVLRDPAEAARRGAAARRVAEERLSWAKLGEEMEAFYEGTARRVRS